MIQWPEFVFLSVQMQSMALRHRCYCDGRGLLCETSVCTADPFADSVPSLQSVAFAMAFGRCCATRNQSVRCRQSAMFVHPKAMWVDLSVFRRKFENLTLKSEFFGISTRDSPHPNWSLCCNCSYRDRTFRPNHTGSHWPLRCRCPAREVHAFVICNRISMLIPSNPPRLPSDSSLTCSVCVDYFWFWMQIRTAHMDTVARWCVREYVFAKPTVSCNSIDRMGTHSVPVHSPPPQLPDYCRHPLWTPVRLLCRRRRRRLHSNWH